MTNQCVLGQKNKKSKVHVYILSFLNIFLSVTSESIKVHVQQLYINWKNWLFAS